MTEIFMDKIMYYTKWAAVVPMSSWSAYPSKFGHVFFIGESASNGHKHCHYFINLTYQNRELKVWLNSLHLSHTLQFRYFHLDKIDLFHTNSA